MTNFQPGDTVIVINDGAARWGQRGTVTAVLADRALLPVRVKFENGGRSAFTEQELKRA